MRISDWSSDVCSSDLRLVERLHAAIEDDLELREVALQGIDHLVAQRRHLAVLLRAESAQPGLAGVDREGTAAGGGKRFYESLQRVVAVLLVHRSEEHTSELQSLMRISYAVFCLHKKQELTPHETTQV